MTIFYADSSAIVKRHVNETGSAWVRMLCDPSSGNIILTSRITMAEVYSAFCRRKREADISSEDCQNLMNDFKWICLTEYELLDISGAVIECAKLMLERHVLRAYDAIQLASALTANQALTNARLSPLTFIIADDRLLKAAQAEGLATDNPNIHV